MLMQILERTPPWVFVLFVALIVFGLFQTRTRHVPMARVTIVPLALIGLSAAGVWSNFGGTLPLALPAWLAGIAAAVLLNQWLRWPRKIGYTPATRRFLVEGSWLPLALMMAIFFTRYVTTVLLAMNPALAAAPELPVAIGFAYGLMSGSFVARALRILAAKNATPAYA